MSNMNSSRLQRLKKRFSITTHILLTKHQQNSMMTAITMVSLIKHLKVSMRIVQTGFWSSFAFVLRLSSGISSLVRQFAIFTIFSSPIFPPPLPFPSLSSNWMTPHHLPNSFCLPNQSWSIQDVAQSSVPSTQLFSSIVSFLVCPFPPSSSFSPFRADIQHSSDLFFFILLIFSFFSFSRFFLPSIPRTFYSYLTFGSFSSVLSQSPTRQHDKAKRRGEEVELCLIQRIKIMNGLNLTVQKHSLGLNVYSRCICQSHDGKYSIHLLSLTHLDMNFPGPNGHHCHSIDQNQDGVV